MVQVDNKAVLSTFPDPFTPRILSLPFVYIHGNLPLFQACGIALQTWSLSRIRRKPSLQTDRRSSKSSPIIYLLLCTA
jgi:hypothetical protein